MRLQRPRWHSLIAKYSLGDLPGSAVMGCDGIVRLLRLDPGLLVGLWKVRLGPRGQRPLRTLSLRPASPPSRSTSTDRGVRGGSPPPRCCGWQTTCSGWHPRHVVPLTSQDFPCPPSIDPRFGPILSTCLLCQAPSSRPTQRSLTCVSDPADVTASVACPSGQSVRGLIPSRQTRLLLSRGQAESQLPPLGLLSALALQRKA